MNIELLVKQVVDAVEDLLFDNDDVDGSNLLIQGGKDDYFITTSNYEVPVKYDKKDKTIKVYLAPLMKDADSDLFLHFNDGKISIRGNGLNVNIDVNKTIYSCLVCVGEELVFFFKNPKRQDEYFEASDLDDIFRERGEDHHYDPPYS